MPTIACLSAVAMVLFVPVAMDLELALRTFPVARTGTDEDLTVRTKTIAVAGDELLQYVGKATGD